MSLMNNKPLLKLSIAAGLLTIFELSPEPAMADFFNESTLTAKLVNEYRHADRPSATPPQGPGVDAWVQALLLNYSSGKIFNTIGAESGFYRVQKLDADPDKSTRAYLDGHDSFDLLTAAITLDFSDIAQFKIGRFVTDYNYGGLQHAVPLISSRSQRVVPILSQGALWQADMGNLHLYGLYREASAGGFQTNWGRESNTNLSALDGLWVDQDEPSYSLAGVWDDDSLLAMLGVGYKDDHSSEYMGEIQRKWATSNDNAIDIKARAYYVDLTGSARERLAEASMSSNTHVLTTQAAYSFGKTRLFASSGHVGNKLARWAGINTDITYPFDLSIGRDHHDMYSLQVGGFHALSPSTRIGATILATRGYESHQEEVRIEGIGINLMASHTFQNGPLSGLKSSIILNKGQENRTGSNLGDKLDFYDIKATLEYTFDIL